MRARSIRVLLLLLPCAAPLRAQQKTTPLQRIVAIARDAKLPLGIVIGTDGLLCREDKLPLPGPSADPLAAIRSIAQPFGYEVSGTNPAIVRNTATASNHLRDALEFHLKNFPAMRATMPDLSATLSGWVQVGFDHTSGYAMSIGITPGAEKFSLPATPDGSVEQIADTIVFLGTKGVWIASENKGTPLNQVNIRAYSYKDDLQRIQSLKCD
jgi:hypothetical protein